jgi:hypothetical protein
MRSMQWQLAVLGTICAFAYRQTQGNQEKPVPRWPVAGPSGYRLLASNPATNSNNTHSKNTRKTTQYTQVQLHLAAMHTGNTRGRMYCTYICSPTRYTIWS